eukprot:267795-Prymnesium_polylepis.1
MADTFCFLMASNLAREKQLFFSAIERAMACRAVRLPHIRVLAGGQLVRTFLVPGHATRAVVGAALAARARVGADLVGEARLGRRGPGPVKRARTTLTDGSERERASDACPL